jgi:S-adenosylmethionine hydrolase
VYFFKHLLGHRSWLRILREGGLSFRVQRGICFCLEFNRTESRFVGPESAALPSTSLWEAEQRRSLCSNSARKSFEFCKTILPPSCCKLWAARGLWTLGMTGIGCRNCLTNCCDTTLRQRRPRSFVFAGLIVVLLITLAAPLGGGQRDVSPASRSHTATIVFMTDFGADNDAVPICKGVMLSIDPDVRIIDLTHQVTPYSILEGARFLYGTTPYYPAGTIFEVVVDPTVGSSRKAVVVKSKRGQYFVLPDNGLMTMVQDRDGLDGAREITNPEWMIGRKLSSTFHGRDIFSPAAAHLARGDDWTEAGPEVPIEKLVRLNIPIATLLPTGIRGTIVAIDRPFGSLISNIEGDDFLKLGYAHGDQVSVTLGEKLTVLPFVKTFSDVAVGKPLLYIDSRGHVAVAINQGNYSATYHVTPPAAIFVARKPG